MLGDVLRRQIAGDLHGLDHVSRKPEPIVIVPFLDRVDRRLFAPTVISDDLLSG